MTENTSIFTSLEKYLTNISVLSSEMILIAIFTCPLIIVVLWLSLRKSRLWYWKVNTKVETLKRIDDRLMILESKMADKNALFHSEPEPETEPKESEMNSSIEIEQPKLNQLGDVGRLKNISKTGRIYTVEELEILIQD